MSTLASVVSVHLAGRGKDEISLDGFALFADQGHTLDLFDAGDWIPNTQTSLILRAPYPQSANRLLAPVQNF